MSTGGPILGSLGLRASAAVRTDPCAPVSITNGNGPFPSMQTLAIAATWDCRVLTVTPILVPPPASRLAPAQPWPAGGSANCTIPAVLILLPAVPSALLPLALPPPALPPPALLPPAHEVSAAPAARTAQHAASRRAGSRQCRGIGSPNGARAAATRRGQGVGNETGPGRRQRGQRLNSVRQESDQSQPVPATRAGAAA